VKVLFDHGTPVPLRQHLPGHSITTAYEKNWHTLRNGELMGETEADAFEVLVSTDQSLPNQQSLTGRAFGVVVLTSTSWPKMQAKLAEIAKAVDEAKAGQYTIVRI
jgi:hypothetical protein